MPARSAATPASRRSAWPAASSAARPAGPAPGPPPSRWPAAPPRPPSCRSPTPASTASASGLFRRGRGRPRSCPPRPDCASTRQARPPPRSSLPAAGLRPHRTGLDPRRPGHPRRPAARSLSPKRDAAPRPALPGQEALRIAAPRRRSRRPTPGALTGVPGWQCRDPGTATSGAQRGAHQVGEFLIADAGGVLGRDPDGPLPDGQPRMTRREAAIPGRGYI
jgi:translation initiation factor IF-2